MTYASSYLKTVRRRLSELALERGDDPIAKPAVVKADVRVVLQALRDAEAEIARLSTLPGAPDERELKKEFDTEQVDDPDDPDGERTYDTDEARDAYYGDLGIRP